MNRASAAINNFKKVSHVIFDLDGLLLDSETIYRQAIINVVQRYGKEYNYDLNRQVLGLPALELAEFLVKTLKLPISPGEFLDAKVLEQEKLQISDVNLMPDTEKIYKSVINDIAKKYGKEYTTDIMKKLLGTTQVDTCKIAVAEMKLPITPEKFNDYFDSQTKLRLANVDFMPGAEKFVQHLYKHKVPIAVATSSSKESYDIKTQKHLEFFKMFHHKVTGGSDPEVKKGKPFPDIFLICASRFPDKPNPSKCLVLEDAPNGVLAAVRAGMQCVMIPEPELVSPNFQSQATLMLKSLTELKPEWFGLPPYQQ